MPSTRYLQYRASLAEGVPSKRDLSSLKDIAATGAAKATKTDDGAVRSNEEVHASSFSEQSSKDSSPSLTPSSKSRSYQQYRSSLAQSIPKAPSPPPSPASLLSPASQAAQAVKSPHSPRYTAYRSTLAKQASVTTTPTTTTTNTPSSNDSSDAERVVPETTTTTSPTVSADASILANAVATKNVPSNTHESPDNANVTKEENDQSDTKEMESSTSSSDEESESESDDTTQSDAEQQVDNAQEHNQQEQRIEGKENKTENEGSMRDLQYDKNRDAEMEQLGTRLSTFLAKAEKGKQQEQTKPMIPTTELDLHTSWSDFDPDDMPDTASRVSTASRRGNKKSSVLAARQQELIQQAIRASQAEMNKDVNPASSQLNTPQPEAERSSDPNSFPQESSRSAVTTKSEEQSPQEIPAEQDSHVEKDLESGLEAPESEEMTSTNRKKWSTYCLLFSLIAAMVLLILAFVLGLG